MTPTSRGLANRKGGSGKSSQVSAIDEAATAHTKMRHSGLAASSTMKPTWLGIGLGLGLGIALGLGLGLEQQEGYAAASVAQLARCEVGEEAHGAPLEEADPQRDERHHSVGREHIGPMARGGAAD